MDGDSRARDRGGAELKALDEVDGGAGRGADGGAGLDGADGHPTGCYHLNSLCHALNKELVEDTWMIPPTNFDNVTHT